MKKYPSLQSASVCKDFQNLKINGNGCNQDESQVQTLDLTNKQHNGKISTNNELDLNEDQKWDWCKGLPPKSCSILTEKNASAYYIKLVYDWNQVLSLGLNMIPKWKLVGILKLAIIIRFDFLTFFSITFF